MIALLKTCKLVMTDSGGLQKESYFFRKFCITLRNETEWVELVENNCNFIAGYDSKVILDLFSALSKKSWNSELQLYGGGFASNNIVDAIEAHANSNR